ncbi:hypothetical protein [Desulfurispora thermophila]|nr:hypothetical protein [Desulfurispora thermophila]
MFIIAGRQVGSSGAVVAPRMGCGFPDPAGGALEQALAAAPGGVW